MIERSVMLHGMGTIDEFDDAALARELERRAKAKETGLCNYCWRPPFVPACMYPDRHAAAGKVPPSVTIPHMHQASRKHSESYGSVWHTGRNEFIVAVVTGDGADYWLGQIFDHEASAIAALVEQGEQLGVAKATRGGEVPSVVIDFGDGGIGNVAVFDEVRAGRYRAHEKHGINSIEAKSAGDLVFWMACLGEEFGEVMETLTYDKLQEGWTDTRAELIDVMSVASAWIDAIDRGEGVE